MEKLGVVKEYCRFCEGETFQNQFVRQAGPHYAEQCCVACNNHIKFLKKPKNGNKRGKASKHTPRSLGIDKCILCQREKAELVNFETLEIHHIIQVADGGPDTPENIWVVCTPCHRMVHYLRTYIRRGTGEYGK